MIYVRRLKNSYQDYLIFFCFFCFFFLSYRHVCVSVYFLIHILRFMKVETVMIYLCKFNAFDTNGEYLREVWSIGNIIERSHRLRQMISISNGYLVRHPAIPHSQKVQWHVLACKRSSWSPIIIISSVFVLIKRKTKEKGEKEKRFVCSIKKIFSLLFFFFVPSKKKRKEKSERRKIFVFILINVERASNFAVYFWRISSIVNRRGAFRCCL